MKQQFKTLDNGLRIATDVMDSIETVSVSVLVKTGSRHENEKNNGISHFLEHMAFKGTATRSAKQIAEEFDSIGGYFNAYTSREKTVYYAKVLKNDLSVAVDILADILQNSLYEEAELEKERKVILEEMKMIQDTPDDLVFDFFQDIAYQNQSFGRSIIGTEETVNSINRADIIDYVANQYNFKDIIIGAAGNFDQDKFRDLIAARFTNFSNNVENKFETPAYTYGDFRKVKDLEQVHLVMGCEGVSYKDPRYYDQQVLAIIAGGGMSSRFFQEIREKRGLAYSVSAFGSSYSDSGVFGIYCGTSEDKTNEFFDVVCDEMKKLAYDIAEEELKRAKAQVKASLLMSQESSVSRAEKLVGNLAVFGKYMPVDEIIAKIELVNIDSVQDFAKKILSDSSRLTLASIGKIDKLYSYDEIVKKLA
ncbi:MAG: M16 family metallopeptidase [Rickettsiales bacterium]